MGRGRPTGIRYMGMDDRDPNKKTVEQLADSDSRRIGFHVGASLIGVTLLHLLGRFGYYQGFYGFVVSDTITLAALLLLGVSATRILDKTYDVPTMGWMALGGTVLMVLGQGINVLDGIPAFGGAALPVERSLVYCKEPILIIGVVLFVGSLYYSVYEAHRAKREVVREREALAAKVEERRAALQEVGRAREQLEERVAARTADLTELNRRLQCEIAERHQAGWELKESEARLRSLMEASFEGIAITENGRVIDMNSAFADIVGYPPEEIRNKDVSVFVAPEHVEMVMERMRNGYQRPYEHKVVRKSGTIIDVEVQGTALTFKGRLCRGTAVRDVTERKRAEEALRDSEETLRFMIETVEDVLWQMTLDLRFTYMSPAVERQCGYLASEVVGRSLRDFLVPHSVAAVEEQFSVRGQRLVRGELLESITYEFEFICKNGTVIWCEAVSTPILDTAGKPRGFQGVTRDVTRRKRTEEALRESEAKYRELVQSANSVILRMDVAGRVTFFNNFAQQFFGYTEDEILGCNVVGTILAESAVDGRGHAAMIRDITMFPERYTTNENENLRKNGERVWISWTNRPIYDAEHRVKEILCIGNDVTERVHAQQLLVEQQARMLNTARLSALGTMASGIAHEINNPMAIVSVGAEQLEKQLQNPEASREYMVKVTHTIVRNVGRVHRIIEGLRNLSRDGACDSFNRESVKAVVANTLEVCQARCRDAGITLTVSSIPDDLYIDCRAAQLSQVLLNLLNNAFDAVRTLPEKWIRLEVSDEGGHVSFSVADSGHGVKSDLWDKVFTPFFTTKENSGGIGLGLSISRAMIESHQGELLLDSACPNTRFIIRLPKSQGNEPA